MDHYPPSFRYYDCILVMIKERIAGDRRTYNKMKQRIGKVFEDKLSLTEKLGLGKIFRKLKSKRKSILLKSQN